MGDLPVGAVFAGHRLETVLGRGGMGVVYLALHERLKRRRALKVISAEMSSDAQFRRRFERESELAASIEHPHVIPIYDAGEEDDQLYIAMRYVEGTDMDELIRDSGKLDLPLTALIVTQVASGLDAAHARNLVHRDVKPANVLIEGHGEGSRSYLSDFGLTKAIDGDTSKLTSSDVILGTLDYIAPEQLVGAPSAASDVYSLGCLVFHAVSGHVPYPNLPAPAKMWAHLNAPPPTLHGGLRAVSDVVARAMAKDPAERYGSAGAFAGALADAVVGTSVPIASTRGDGERPRRPTGPSAPSTLATPRQPPPLEAAAQADDHKTEPDLPGPRGRRRGIIVAGGALALLAVGLALSGALNGGGEHPAHRAVAATKPGYGQTRPLPAPAAAQVDSIKRVVLEYGRTTNSKKTCSLETDRLKKKHGFKNPAQCHYTGSGLRTIIHYRILNVALHGQRAIVQVTTLRFGDETIYLVKSPDRGWLIDDHIRPDVLRIKAVVLKYVRTRHHNGAVHGRVVKVVPRQRATVEVTGGLGDQTIHLVWSPARGWLIDRIVHA